MSDAQEQNGGADRARPEQTDEHGIAISPERLRYAAILKHGVRVGIGVLVVTYALYVTGVVEAHVSPEELTHHWDAPADRYTEAIGMPRGWGWVMLLPKADVLNLVGIGLLGMLTIGAFLALLPSYVARRDWLFAAIVLLQVIVLIVAASGVLDVGA